MGKIDFGAMSKRKRALYECMWGSEDFDFPVEKTIFKRTLPDHSRTEVPSNNSYTFAGASAVNKDLCADRLADLFNIQHRELFREKFDQSCGGDGQERKRIAVLHSSALCALLFFYNVSKENPYGMEIEGETYIFTDSRFEYQNTVIEGRNPSNVDVVLIGTDSAGKPAVLFLESKFSEYYEGTGKRLEVAAAYLDDRCGNVLYGKSALEKLELDMITREGDETFTLCSKESCYLEGIKQMISHYIGLRNLCEKPDGREDAVAREISAGARVLLGEILFTKGIGQLPVRNGGECLASYRKKYMALAAVLNEQLEKDGISGRFTVLRDILSYSQFQDKAYIQEPLVRRFYFELGRDTPCQRRPAPSAISAPSAVSR